MKKTTKGTIAAGAALMLLLGTGGTLAYWNDSANLSGQNSITAGQLRVAQNGAASWSIKHQNGTASAVSDITTVRIVPGDQLIYTGNYNVTAEGQDLAFKVDLAAGSIAAATAGAADTALAGRLTAATTFSVNGGAATAPGTAVTVAKPTGADNGVKTHTVVITATITWPFGTDASSATADNPAKQGKVNLSQFALTVTQVAGN
ncbi:MAG: alternate-type signal peptide domain-containing protein [Microbacterium sp.]|nr:MAG: alternate-type signal peptide domain-containing protein [Microbacterium sp.]